MEPNLYLGRFLWKARVKINPVWSKKCVLPMAARFTKILIAVASEINLKGISNLGNTYLLNSVLQPFLSDTARNVPYGEQVLKTFIIVKLVREL